MQTVKVKIFCQQPRELRVMGVVLTHLKSSLWRYQLAAPQESGDILVVDDGDPQMQQQCLQASSIRPQAPVIHLVDTPSPRTGRHELVYGQLLGQLLPMLDRAMQAPRTVPAPIPATAERLRALVVDDSATVRTQLAGIIERLGMQCDVAESAAAALQRLQASTQGYHVVFADVVMPEMDGYKLTREIKRHPEHKNTPVIILTSQSSPFDRARGALVGCDSYLTKPVTLSAFHAALSKVLRKRLGTDDLSAWLRAPAQALA